MGQPLANICRRLAELYNYTSTDILDATRFYPSLDSFLMSAPSGCQVRLLRLIVDTFKTA